MLLGYYSTLTYCQHYYHTFIGALQLVRYLLNLVTGITQGIILKYCCERCKV